MSRTESDLVNLTDPRRGILGYMRIPSPSSALYRPPHITPIHRKEPVHRRRIEAVVLYSRSIVRRVKYCKSRSWSHPRKCPTVLGVDSACTLAIANSDIDRVDNQGNCLQRNLARFCSLSPRSLRSATRSTRSFPFTFILNFPGHDVSRISHAF